VLIFDPKDQFTRHIDAPAEDRVIEKQALVEGTHGGPGAEMQAKRATDNVEAA
jgi:hypothetical protein